MMDFLLNLLRIKGLYMFRALLAHPQAAIQNGTLYIACLLCHLATPGLEWKSNPGAFHSSPSAICRAKYQVPFWSAS
jgi:hypothetical protein